MAVCRCSAVRICWDGSSTGRFGEQTGADPERVREAIKRLELVYCEMAPGTGLYFHGNTLHCSAANTSDKPRWGLLCCYNTRANDPYKEHHHPRYTPLIKLPDSAIKAVGAKPSAATQSFLAQQKDRTTGGRSKSLSEMAGIRDGEAPAEP